MIQDGKPTCYAGPDQEFCMIHYTLPNDLKDDTTGINTYDCGCQIIYLQSSSDYKSIYGYWAGAVLTSFG